MTQTLALPALRGSDRGRAPAPGERAGQLVRRRERRAGRRRLLADLPRTPPAARGTGRAPSSSRAPRTACDFVTVAEVRPRRVRRRVVRAARSLLPSSRRRLAALPLLRDPRLEALVDRGRRRRRPGGPARRDRGPSCCPVTTDVAVKDPVILVDERGWRMWVCEHPLTEPGHEDRMTTAYATSSRRPAPGTRHGTVLAPTAGTWDAARRPRHGGAVRGPAGRAVRRPRPRRGQLARGHRRRPCRRDGVLHADGRRRAVMRSPHTDGALRYAAAVPLPGRPHAGSTSRPPGPTGPTT